MADNRHRKVDRSEQPHVDIIPEDVESILTMTDENDEEIEFYERAVVTYEDSVYGLMEPVEPMEGLEEGEAIFMRIEPYDDDNDSFIPVGDDDLIDKLFDLYLKKIADLETRGEDTGTETDGADTDTKPDKDEK